LDTNESALTWKLDLKACLSMLTRWMDYAERQWYPIPGRKGLGCYGTGYNNWAVQTNQKYLAALAMLAANGNERALERSLAALRFSLASHKSGPFHCTDGTQWGHTWISSLGIERMMYGVHHLEPWLTAEDRNDLRRVMVSEAEWLFDRHERYGHKGIFGEIWEKNGKNHPESNLWNGALLWRAAMMYPDELQAEAWKERSHVFLINAISIRADEEDPMILAGKPVRERFIGANYFPHFALDHRGFMNLGYMVICASNAAMLHFDMKLKGFETPETLYHHEQELWHTIRRMIFPNGRLARIGGNTRIGYTYTQEYLLPSLLFGADCFHDPHAMGLANAFLRMAETEQLYHGDGSFYSRRLKRLAAINPYYPPRLESDRACVIGMAIAYAPLVKDGAGDNRSELEAGSFEESVRGLWCEPDHGSVMHRSPTRLASFVWRSLGLTQGLCQPPHNGHLAEWDRNLGGLVEAVHHVYENRAKEQFLYPHLILKPPPPHRRLLDCRVETFDGGFLTFGSVLEGTDIEIADGWYGTDTAVHQIVFAALPDDHSVVGLQYCRTAPRRTYFREVQGLHFNLLNDFYNGFRRKLATANGTLVLEGLPERDEIIGLASRWVNIDDCVGIIGLYGAQTLSVCRLAQEHWRRSEFSTMNVEEIAWQVRRGCIDVDPDQLILDVGWMVLSSADADQTQMCAKRNSSCLLESYGPKVRVVRVQDFFGREYAIIANFASECLEIKISERLIDLVSSTKLKGGDRIQINSGQGRILSAVK
jgi:hypothetical protein